MVFALKLLAAMFAGLPRSTALNLGKGLGWVYGNVIRYHRGDAFASLTRSFPEKSAEEIRGVVQRMYRHLGLNMAEFLRVLGGKAGELEELIDVRGLEHVEQALARGNGALALVSHLGNWELLALAMARRFQPSGMIIKELRQGSINDYLIQSRESLGLMVFPRRGAYRSCLKALRSKALIGFVLDQNMMWKEGVFVDFFGKPACTTPGLAHLAAHAGAPVVPMVITRGEDGRHELVAHPLLEPPESKEPEVIRKATQEYTTIIEKGIRARPEQWIWIHRRWRTTPDKVEQVKKLQSAAKEPGEDGFGVEG